VYKKILQKKAYKKITADDLKFVMENDEPPLLVDVCEEWEFHRSHIEGAVNIPLSIIDTFVHEITTKYPEYNEIVVYCTLGVRSKTAATILNKHGFKNVYSLIGGSTSYFRSQQ